MVKELERLALRSKTFVVGFNIYNNWRFSRRLRVGNAASDHGVVHAGLDLPASLGDIDISYDVFVKCQAFPPRCSTVGAFSRPAPATSSASPCCSSPPGRSAWPRLLPRYRRLPTEELLTSGIFVLDRKP
jgi:hypothetical protein